MSMTPNDLEMLIKVIFQGFNLVLGWHQDVLDSTEKWGLQMATYSAIVGFFVLFGVSGWALGERAFQSRDLTDAAEVLDGSTPMDEPLEEIGISRRRRILTAILDAV